MRLYHSHTLANGKHPVVLQVIFKKTKDSPPKVRRKRTGYSASKDQWDNNRFKTSARNGRYFNRKLDELEDKAWSICHKHFDDRPFNYKMFSSFLDKGDINLDLQSLMDEVGAELILQGRAGTEMSYRNAVDNAYSYHGPSKLLLREIDVNWLRGYEKYNLAKGNKCNVYMRSIKALFGKAMERYYIDAQEMPFKTKYQPRGYCFAHLHKVTSKCKNTDRIKILTIEEMSKILAYQPNNRASEQAMDYFLFSYFNMGVNLKDMALLQMKDIKNGLWCHSRQKSGVIVQGKPLTKPSLEIITKYYQKGNKYVFNEILGDQYSQSEEAIKRRIRDVCSNLSRRYKRISRDIGLNGYFTINTARHSAATISKQLGGDIKAISNLLNHKSIQTTNNYIGDPRTEQMKIALETLQIQ